MESPLFAFVDSGSNKRLYYWYRVPYTQVQVYLKFQPLFKFGCFCKEGFYGTGYICSDIDECLVLKSACSENQQCFNSVGNFQCSCKDGFEMIGDHCTGKFRIQRLGIKTKNTISGSNNELFSGEVF